MLHFELSPCLTPTKSTPRYPSPHQELFLRAIPTLGVPVDCITYHLVRSAEEGWNREEVIDALNVALLVGGSITIPHLRRAFARMREIDGLKPSAGVPDTPAHGSHT